MRKLVLTTTALACALGFAATRIDASEQRVARRVPDLAGPILRYQHEAWRWQRLMGLPRTPSAHSAARSPAADDRRWVLRLWRRRALRARRLAASPPHGREFRCIHRYEGRWNANTGNGYYGGLQMDISFQRHYGAFLLRRKGTADHWTPVEQIWVAERARRSGRGFAPWPNTARACGLL